VDLSDAPPGIGHGTHKLACGSESSGLYGAGAAGGAAQGSQRFESWNSRVLLAPRAGGAPGHNYSVLCLAWQRGDGLFRRAWSPGCPRLRGNWTVRGEPLDSQQQGPGLASRDWSDGDKMADVRG
jgi:hypothetical protein